MICRLGSGGREVESRGESRKIDRRDLESKDVSLFNIWTSHANAQPDLGMSSYDSRNDPSDRSDLSQPNRTVSPHNGMICLIESSMVGLNTTMGRDLTLCKLLKRLRSLYDVVRLHSE